MRSCCNQHITALPDDDETLENDTPTEMGSPLLIAPNSRRVNGPAGRGRERGYPQESAARGAPREAFSALLEARGALLGACGAPLEACGAPLGASKALLGACGAPLGASKVPLEACGALLGASKVPFFLRAEPARSDVRAKNGVGGAGSGLDGVAASYWGRWGGRGAKGPNGQRAKGSKLEVVEWSGGRVSGWSSGEGAGAWGVGRGAWGVGGWWVRALQAVDPRPADSGGTGGRGASPGRGCWRFECEGHSPSRAHQYDDPLSPLLAKPPMRGRR
jgi:hypothetical protein